MATACDGSGKGYVRSGRRTPTMPPVVMTLAECAGYADRPVMARRFCGGGERFAELDVARPSASAVACALAAVSGVMSMPVTVTAGLA